jgi:DNA-binding NtrC family response regulator
MITEKILVVDDEEDVCRSVRKVLTRRGFAVETASGADDAVQKINDSAFDLVITDLMMPKTDGMELLRIIRDHYPGLDVIMITGYASIDSAVAAMKLGAAGYLPKPFTPDELMVITRKTLDGRRHTHRGGRPAARHDILEKGEDLDEMLDVDMPFSTRDLIRATSPAYVERLTRSDIPLAGKAVGAATVRLPEITRHRPQEVRPPKRPRQSPGGPIDVDIPFPADAVEQVTGPDYLDRLDRSDVLRPALHVSDNHPRQSVLVVDDEPVVCRSVRRILSRHRCRVEEAFDADDVFERMRLNSYDLVILDLKLPRRSGMEVLRTIRRLSPDVPVIMISGYASIESAVEAIRWGASHFLPKPFTSEELVKVAEELLIR